MDTFKNLCDELASRLMVADNSTLYTTDRIKTLIKDAHLWATSFYPWPETVKAKKTTTGVSESGQFYYDYPDTFRTDTIQMLYINGKYYSKRAYDDYLEYKRKNPTSTKRIFADWGRQYFIFPTPADGLQIDVYGCEQVTQLSADGDRTIFSLSDQQGNEAIVKKAFSVAIKRVDANLSIAEEKDAIGILSVIWNKRQESRQSSQRLDRPLFNVPDFFAGAGSSGIGNFSIATGEPDED